MKLTDLHEAKYQEKGQGTLAWFIHNFFDHYQDHQDYTGAIYKVKDEYEITVATSNKRVLWIDSWETPEGDYDWEFQDDRARSAGAGPDQVVVKRIKVVWDPKNVYAGENPYT
jgi:hypothetical protein